VVGSLVLLDYVYRQFLTFGLAAISGGPTYTLNASSSGNIDGLGRLTQAQETISYPSQSNRSHAYTLGYNMQSGLTDASITNINGSTCTANYSYKKDGNIETKTINSSDTDYEYDTNAVNGSVFDSDIMTKAGGDSLVWDANGRLAATPTVSFEYNGDGKLRKATIGSNSIALKYDPQGNRVYKASSVAGNCKYIVDVSGGLPTILCEIDPTDGSLKKSYVYANGQILCQYDGETDPNRYFYVHDRLGSVRLVTDAFGTVRNSYTYNSFGEMFPTECNEAVYNPFKFIGQWFDSEIGQYYLRARMYDPVLMRFTGRDPVRGKFQNPLTLHPYLYCVNNPINATDKTGRLYESLLADALLADLRAQDTRASVNFYNWAKEGINVCEAYMNARLLAGIMMYEEIQGAIVGDIEMDVAKSIAGWFLPTEAKVIMKITLYKYGVMTGDNSAGPDIPNTTSWLGD